MPSPGRSSPRPRVRSLIVVLFLNLQVSTTDVSTGRTWGTITNIVPSITIEFTRKFSLSCYQKSFSKSKAFGDQIVYNGDQIVYNNV